MRAKEFILEEEEEFTKENNWGLSPDDADALLNYLDNMDGDSNITTTFDDYPGFEYMYEYYSRHYSGGDYFWAILRDGLQDIRDGYLELDKDVDEGWKDWVAGAALGAAALGAQAKPNIVQQYVEPGDTIYSIARQNNVDPKIIMKLNNFDRNTKLKKGQMVKVPDTAKPVETPKAKAEKSKQVEKPKEIEKQIDTSKTVTGTKHEAILRQYAEKANIKGNELIAFLSQAAHETLDFKHMIEIGGSLDFKKYDPKFAPAKAKQLGNTEVGDGARYKGRGYIQLTGRYNYRKAGEALGLPLEQKPELVEKPEIAAKVAIWYWKNRVKPNVDDFKDVKGVTKPINPGLKGLEDRKEKYQAYKVALK